MNWPTSQDYNEAIQNAATSVADPDLKSGEATVNAIGLPVPRSGNFADVYQFKGADGKMWAVKCFTRQVEGLQERYTKINQYLERARLPFTVGFKYLAEGIRIRGQWFPLLKMEWVEGFTLNEFVRQNVDKPNYLHGLMQMWGKLTGKLRDANIAHADLQHGNVLLVPGNTPAKLGLKLIDYDGMWVPPLADYHSGEVGHPNFQHPLRLKDRLFNADVDRFAHLVIACALRGTLLGGKRLWDKYDNGDNLLFREQDLRDPEKSAVFKSLWELNDDILRTLVGNIALASKQPLRKTPWLDDLLLDEESPRLSPEQEKQTVAMLGVAPPPAKAPAAVPAVPEFAQFDVTDDDEEQERALPLRVEDDEDRERQARRRSYRSRKSTTRSKKSNLPLLIGGGAGILVLIVVATALVVRAGKGRPSTEKDPEPIALSTDSDEKPRPRKQPTKVDDSSKPKETNPANADTPKVVDTEPVDLKDDPSIYVPPGFPWRGPIAGVATIPGRKSFLFFDRNEPALWMVDDGSNSPWEFGKTEAPIKALACSLNGNTAIAGSSDGSLRVWPLPMVHISKIKDFMGEYGYSAFHDSVVMRDNATGMDEVVPAGKPGQMLKMFKDFYASRNFAQSMGEAMTEEVRIFDGAMTVQVFEKGVILLERKSRKLWANWHQPRTAVPRQFSFKEHTKAIAGCAISGDGTRAASVGEDNQLCWYDLAERKTLGKFSIPASASIAFLEDRSKVLIGTASQSVEIWDLEKGVKIKELSGHAGAVNAVCVSVDGKIAATGGEDGIIRVWDLASGTLKRTLRRQENPPVKGLSMMPDGRLLASADGELGRAFWDLETGRFLSGSGASNGAEKLMCISLFTFNSGQSAIGGWETPNGGRIDGFRSGLRVPKVVAKKSPPAGEKKGRDTWVSQVGPQKQGVFQRTADKRWQETMTNGQRAAFEEIDSTDDYVELFDRSRNITVRLHDGYAEWRRGTIGGWNKIADGRWADASAMPKAQPDGLVLIKEAPASPINANEFGGRTFIRDDGKYVCQISLLRGGGGRLRVLDGDGEEKGVLALPASDFMDVLFGPNSQLFILTRSGVLESRDMEDLKSAKPHPSVQLDPKQNVSGILRTQDPKRVLAGGVSPTVQSWTMDTSWKMGPKYTPQPGAGACIPRCAFPDGRRYVLNVSGIGGSKLVVWSRLGGPGGKIETTLDQVNVINLSYLEVSPSGKWIVGHRTEGASGQFFVWEAASGKLAQTVADQRASHQFIGFDPSGDFLVFQRNQSGPIAILDLQEGKVVRETEPMSIAHGAIARTGLVVTVDTDRKTRLWQLNVNGK